MAPRAPQETLADFQSRLYQKGYEVFDRSLAYEYGRAFWEAHEVSPEDSLHGVPAHTFDSGTTGKHSVRAFEHKAKWFIGVVSWTENPRAINERWKERPLLVGIIPFGENAEEAEAQMRLLARATYGSDNSEPFGEDPFPVK